MKYISHYQQVDAYITKDGYIIKELMHPDINHNHNQSLAEAIIPAHAETQLHKHIASEEIYHITHGEGQMTLGEKTFNVKAGDTICIAPAIAHKIRNIGSSDLKIICCCSPAYSHEDTELI
ncbi:MAG: cupin domain-containing protein [Gammaproteobacteria bacterium]|nr:cupin domain-containing protein [Gammaproteobacteria bacterium]